MRKRAVNKHGFPVELESQIVSSILQWLAYNKILAYRINSGMIRTESGHMVKLAPAGFSDILAILKGGRVCMIECKRPGNRATAIQEFFMEGIRQQGGIAFVATSIADCQRELKSML